MLNFSSWKEKKEKNFWLDKSGSLPVWVIEPPESVLITPVDDERVKKDKSIPQIVSDYITKHF
jgi:hypothetical protein